MGRVFGVLALVSIVLGLVVVLTDRVEDDTSRISLRFSFWGSDTEAAAIEKICRRFEQLRPDVHIITEPLPWGQYWLKMKTQAAGRSGSPPDVIRMTSVASAAWYDRGLLLDLTPYLMRENITLDACFPAAVEAVTWEGRVCSMPTDSAVRILMYNKDLFDKAGISHPDATEPMTWDAFRDLARRLTVREDGRALQYGVSLGYMEFQAFVRQAGGRLVDRTVDPTAMAIDSPRGIRALRLFHDLVVSDRSSPPTRQHQDLGFGGPDFALVSGRIAMQFGGTWSIPGIVADDSDMPIRLGLAPVPRDAQRSQVAFTNSCGISRDSAHPDAAWEFLKFFASPEGQRIVAKEGIGIPVLRSVANSRAFLDNPHAPVDMKVFLDELDVAETNIMASNEEFRDQVEKVIHDRLCLGTLSPEDAAAELDRIGTRLLAPEKLRPTMLTGVVVPVVMGVVALSAVFVAVIWLRRRARGIGMQPTRGENVAGYLFIAPWLIGLTAFALGPMVLAFATSFTDWNIFDSPRYVGAANYERILTGDPEFLQSLKVTFVYALTAIPIQMVGGLLCALLLSARGSRLTGLFRTVLYLPYLFTGVAISIAWRWMYAENGLVNYMLAWIGIQGPNWLMSETWALPAIILMNFTWLGGNMIIFQAALEGVPRSLYDAAQVDGAGVLRRLWHVTLPMISPAVLFNLIMGTIWSFQVFAVPFVMTMGGPNDATLFYVLNLYQKAFKYNRMGYACALAVILFVVIFIVSMIQLRTSRRWVHYEGAR